MIPLKIQEISVPPRFRAPGNALFCFVACLACSLFQIGVMAQQLPEWSCFHGPDRTNKSSDTGLLKEWPEEGPELLWRYEGLGEGHSTVAVVNGRIFATGMIDSMGYIFALDLNGSLLWKKQYGREWTKNYPGSRSTPTIVDGRLYLLSSLGKMLC